ncbi:CDP-alcohol phosphatidyltransferase family protein [Streptomyces sp. ISL-98]|uniref:CDP-alcohol phosphatidyltransferase family protein n=1 Tax=Streptomyces sp. ISL-98 TaxID=2819192 RepID=UPI0027E51D20|nr:CDP-alcohol phosphatidyltransferase family protein [Streptomyces sp. ISL-98]
MPVSDPTDSRAATNALLGALKQDRWRPHAVARFLWQAADRSVRQAAHHPRALTHTTALHGLLLALTRDRGDKAWVATSWTLGALHLGLLEHRDGLSPADALTLLRGNLPATIVGSSRVSGVLAIASDLADGRLARRQATVSPFGDYADSFADAAFWTWLVLRHEPSRAVRAAAIAAWALPVVTVTALAVSRGTMPERPRPALLRPAAAMQGVVAVRHLLRR